MTFEEKGHILREVYEDNRRIRERSWMGKESESGFPWFAVLILVVIFSVVLWSMGDSESEREATVGVIAPGNVAISVPIYTSLLSREIVPTDLSFIVFIYVPLLSLFYLLFRRIFIFPGLVWIFPVAS